VLKGFHKFLDISEKPEQAAKRIKDPEHEADQAAHTTMELFHKCFNPAIERGDMRRNI